MISQEEELLFQKEKQLLLKSLNKLFKRLQKKKNELERSLLNCKNWALIQHEGDLIKANLACFKKSAPSVELWDWEIEQFRKIEVDPLKTPQEEMALRYKRSKKLQRGIEPLKGQVEMFTQKVQHLENQMNELENLKTYEALIDFKTTHFPTVPIPAAAPAKSRVKQPYHEFQSDAGIKIWVGKNAKANDLLTFQLAHGNDWWLHTKGVSGSHVVIKTSRGQEPDQETLRNAIQLALYYSKAKAQGEGEVCLTQRKYVSRLGKSQPGKVQISKHKTIWSRLDLEQLKHFNLHL